MQIAGIVAEYNPFHTGHAHQISETRRVLGGDTPVVSVMSGNWVQQADCAIADKWTRARLALMGGADLVLELPTVFAASSAEKFAQGAVEILESTGVISHLSFGSECGDVCKLQRVAAGLDSPEYVSALQELTNSGLPFAVCRQSAAETVLGTELGSLVRKPNNNLGIEYIRALNGLKSHIQPLTVQRKGAAHNSVIAVMQRDMEGTVLSGPSSMDMPRFVSATQIRCDLLEGNWNLAEPYLVPGGKEILQESMIGLPALQNVHRAMLMKVRTMTAKDWEKLPDSGAAEGLPKRLEKAGRQCTSMNEFFELARTKRYTNVRLERLVLWAYLGLTAEDRPEHPSYIRVLGFNDRGREILKHMKKTASLPVITKPAHMRELDENCLALFELESRCTDLYDLCFETIKSPGREWSTGPVILR